MRPNLSLVMVTWEDAWAKKSDEVTLEDVASSHVPTVVQTIGWLLLNDDRGVSIANEHYEGTYRGRTFIPKAMVTHIEPLVAPRRSRRKASEPPT